MKKICLMFAGMTVGLSLTAGRIDVYPQSFRGGWGLDVASMEVLGSPYLIAHGMGRPVPDAVAGIDVPQECERRVWVRTRNWTEGAPGKFRLVIDGRELPHVFGCGSTNWTWEAGDIVKLPKGHVTLALRDLSGFDGRCAGVVLAPAGAPGPVGALDVRGQNPSVTREFDFVVVGGGLPGCCAAIAAARAGIRTALVQDRPVLGGNASSEIRVWCAGEMRHPLVEELRGLFMNRDPLAAERDRSRLAALQREPNLSLFLSHRAFAVEKEGDAISSVKAIDLARNRVVAFRAGRFCDATGDGWIGYWAGADYSYGREARSETGERWAPEKADKMVMGASVMWNSSLANDDVEFSAPWAEPFAQGGAAVNGEWFWEYGHWCDMVGEDEHIRDRLLLAIYGAFSLAKKDKTNSRRMLTTCPYVLGKRESRRLTGDVLLKETDVSGKTLFEDSIATGTWSVDLHFPHPTVPYMAKNKHKNHGRFYIPYRATYSRNVPNLFMAGRCFSCTHAGLGPSRVINTLSQIGIAVGTAAAMCVEKGCTPRDIFAKGHVRELQRRIGGDWPGNPDPERKDWLYVDDETPGVELEGDWILTRCLNGGMAGDVAHTSHGWKSERAVYPLPVTKSGRYRLYGRIPYNWEYKDCSAVAAVTVSSGGKDTSFAWRQQINTGRWNPIGEAELGPGARLTVKPADWKNTIVVDGFALEPIAFDDAYTVRVQRGEAAKPVSVTTNAAGNLLIDFGKHQVGWIEADVSRAGEYEFIWGELLDARGSVETNSFFTRKEGNIRCARTAGDFTSTGWTRVPYRAEKGNKTFRADPVGRFGTVMPFRWLEIVKAPFSVTAENVRQVPVHYPYDMSESSFACDSEALERVYGFCKHSIRATTYTGRFIDGDRERLPYEGDSYITQLGTYAISSDQTLVRTMVDYLAVHTTWPTEWKQYFIRMVHEDWKHSGKTDLVEKHYALMKDVKSWRSLRREDGLLVTPMEKMTPSPDGGKFRDIVDWAKCYRDGFVFTPVNAVVNALHYRNLKELEEMARAIGKHADADMFAKEAAQTYDSFRRVLFNPVTGLYRDGIGTDHSTVQGNAMALACGIVPPEHVAKIADYVAKKGFSCSTYMAQFVLEALFAAGRDGDAFRLMTSSDHRSWLGMMAKGATITMEFWDLTMPESGRVPDMNHSWSTAPLNMISRWVLGVRPRKPGFEEISVRPHPGPLKRVSGTVPTPKGPVKLAMTRDDDGWSVELTTPVPAEFGFGGDTRLLPPGRHIIPLPR